MTTKMIIFHGLFMDESLLAAKRDSTDMVRPPVRRRVSTGDWEIRNATSRGEQSRL